MSTATLSAKSPAKSKSTSLSVGSVVSETQYYKVQKIVGNDIQLTNDNGEHIIINKTYADNCLDVADYYTMEEFKSRTEIAQLFLSHPYTALTVNFNKQVKVDDVLAEILHTHKNTPLVNIEKEFKKSIKKALEGEERIAVGRHFGTTNEFGRVPFIDMNKEKGAKPDWDGRNIQVDPRTINWFIAKGVKYSVK